LQTKKYADVIIPRGVDNMGKREFGSLPDFSEETISGVGRESTWQPARGWHTAVWAVFCGRAAGGEGEMLSA